MTKLELWNQVQEVLADNKASKKLTVALEELLKPKTGGGVVQNPMITKDGVNYHYCRYTKIYVCEDEIVMSKEKSKGYSKKAIALWTKLGREAQQLNDEAMKLLLDNKIVEGQDKARESEELKTNRNDSSMYEDVKSYYIEAGLGFEN